MSDQIAPSLAGELEQMAKRYRTRLELVALLTRAAALARAAEKVVAVNGSGLGPMLDAIQDLRALVSSEGKGE